MELSPMVWASLLGRVEDLLRGQGLALADVTALATMRQACRQRLGIDGSMPDACRQLQDVPTLPQSKTVHALLGDYAVCGFSQLPFIDWPENHRSTRSVTEVTCTNCRRRL